MQEVRERTEHGSKSHGGPDRAASLLENGHRSGKTRSRTEANVWLINVNFTDANYQDQA